MKNSDIKELKTDEIVTRISEEKLALTKMKFNNKVSGIDNPMKIQFLKKTIARLHTELRSRELQAEVKA